jgi:predicted RNase H-like HicB family nuclease
MMRRYLVVLQPTPTGYSAYSPDLLGCVTTGHTRQEAETNIREAVEFHLMGLRQEGLRVPEPRTEYAHVYIGP